MDVVKGFFDYCLSEECVTGAQWEKNAKLLFNLGYRTVAINQVLEEANLESKKKKKKGESRDAVDIVPSPIDVKSVDGCEDLKVLNRLTVVFSNQEIIHRIIRSPNYKKYHILAIQPMAQSALQFTCSNIEADIFSFDTLNKLTYKLSRKIYNQLLEKGYHFEILYSPAILDTTHRRNTISVSHQFHVYGKSKNVIISSGASSPMLIRSPYDIVNLGLLFGLSEDQAKNAISNNGRSVYVNAVGRRHGKAVMFVENIEEEENKPEEQETDEDMEVDQPAQKKSKQ